MSRPMADTSKPRARRQGDDLRHRVSPPRPASWTRASQRGHRPPALSSDLEDFPPRRAVRGTWASRQLRGEEGASAQNDPRIAKSRLSRRTASGSIEQPGMIGGDFRPWMSARRDARRTEDHPGVVTPSAPTRDTPMRLATAGDAVCLASRLPFIRERTRSPWP